MLKINQPLRLFLTGICFLSAFILNGCDKDNDDNNSNDASFTKVNLVASTNTFAGARVDPNLVNGWGIVFSPSGNAWISAEGTGKSVIYDSLGVEKLAAVSIPTSTATTGGHPTGIVFNATTDFTVATVPSKFIFAATDGTISAWVTGSLAVKVVDRPGAAYTGLAIGSSGGNNYIYAANFAEGKIDVYDKNFVMVNTMPFTDPNTPGGYAPFNIQNVNGQLFVMYAKVSATTHEEEKGDGFGYVDIYGTDGIFVRRFVSQGRLNAPWGIAQAPANYLNNNVNVILIGNFGDGRINAYDANGNFIARVKSGGNDVQIDGLWGISFAPATSNINANWLFFAAGPADEQQGLYGYLKK